MEIVSNTSPLLNLAIVGQLELLRWQFEQVIMPPEVLAELRLGSGIPGTAALNRAHVDGWLVVRPLTDARLAAALGAEIDGGEAAAIALAVQNGTDRVLIDERRGRACARRLGLEPVGVLGVLLRAKHDGRLAALGPTIEALRLEAGFHLSDTLVAEVLRRADEA